MTRTSPLKIPLLMTISLILAAFTGPARAAGCPPVAGLVASAGGVGAAYSAGETASVKDSLNCQYRDPAKDPRSVDAWVNAYWTVSAQKSMWGWCLTGTGKEKEDFELQVDKKGRTIRYTSGNRDIDVQITLSRDQFKRSRRQAWLDFGRRVMEENFERAISCLDGSPGKITAVEMARKKEQAVASQSAPQTPNTHVQSSGTEPPERAGARNSAVSQTEQKSATPPSQNDIADIIERLKKSQAEKD